MSGFIEVCRGATREKVFQLIGCDVSVGRDILNDICLPSRTVSRKHAKITCQNNEYYFEDCSSFGSKVDTETIKNSSTKIQHGATIKIGEYVLFYNANGILQDENSTDVYNKEEITKDIVVRYRIKYYDIDNKKSKDVPLNGFNFVVGSDDKNQIVVKGEGVEPNHLSIRIYEDKAFLQTYSQETYVNGKKVGFTPVYLADGDKIKMGSTIIRFVDDNINGETASYKYHIVARSPEMKKVVNQIEYTAKFSNKSVLITGETGTGKELVAHAIHAVSTRAEQPFVVVNCATLTNELAGSMLFGWTKGSFTGAHDSHEGLFEQAEGGTLFLDEIGELSKEVQALLLRAIEYKDISQIGSKIRKKVDVRIIAATNRNLEIKAEREKIDYREDFYYRLCGLKIHLEPLRNRKEDIPLLMDHFLQMAKVENPELADYSYTEKAYESAKRYSWGGNVRELYHACDRAYFDSRNNIIDKITSLNSEAVTRILVPKIYLPDYLEPYYELYYYEEMNNTQIAKKLKVSRQTAIKYIKELKEYESPKKDKNISKKDKI